MNPLLQKALPYLLASGVLVGAYVSWSHQEREIGKRDLLLAQSTHALDSLKRRSDSLNVAFRVDTVRLTRLLHRWDTVQVSLRELHVDTLRRTDTVKVTVQTLIVADSTIKSCAAALWTCEQRVGLANARATQWQTEATALRRLQPSEFGTWTKHGIAAYVGVQVGCLIGKHQLCLTLH